MVVKVAMPEQFKLKIVPDIRNFFFSSQREIHYIGGSEVLPAPLEADQEADVIWQIGTEYDQEAKKILSREKLIVKMRFGLDHPDGEEKTQKEVADYLGISQSYISRLEKKIMQRLKREMVRYE